MKNIPLFYVSWVCRHPVKRDLPDLFNDQKSFKKTNKKTNPNSNCLVIFVEAFICPDLGVEIK